MAHDQGIRAVVRRLRRGVRKRTSRWLARLGGTPAPRVRPLEPPPARILVVRLNKRMGNTLFTTPLLRSLAATFPDAEIDVLLRGAANEPLLANLPGVRQVHVFGGGLGGALRLIRTLRRRRYDLAVDPSTASASDRFGVRLSGASRRLGFSGSDQWLRLTHAAPPPTVRHLGLQPLQLLTDGVSGLSPILHERLCTHPTAAARTAADEIWRSALEDRDDRPVIGFFTQATGKKRLPAGWWRQWLDAVVTDPQSPRLLQILPSPDAAALAPAVAAVHLEALDRLAALIAKTDLFVAGDCGPMHLAAAAGTPTIGLFRATRASDYAPLGRNCLSLSGTELDPAAAAATALAHLRRLRETGSG